MKKTLLLLVMIVSSFYLQAQHQVPLSHSDYDHWKGIRDASISNNGNFVTYVINPQEGDGWVFFYDVKNKKLDSVARGNNAVFTGQSMFAAFNIKPQFNEVRKLERKKTKKSKMPSDSLAVINLADGNIKKFGQIKSYRMPADEGNWLAVLMKKEDPKKVEKKDKKEAKESKENKASEERKSENKKEKKPKLKPSKGDLLVFYNMNTGDTLGFKNVIQYEVAKEGNALAFVQVPRDTVERIRIVVFDPKKQKEQIVFEHEGFAKNISIDKSGSKLAFTFSTDTVKNKAYQLYYTDLKKNKTFNVSGNDFQNLKKGWSVSTNGSIYFNEAGTELYFGTAPKPLPPLKDTLAPLETVRVDIWNWQDKFLQPQQNVMLNREKNRSYIAVYYPKNNKVVQLADSAVNSVRIDPKAKGIYALGYDDTPYQKMTSWIGHWFNDVYLINKKTGERKLIIKKVAEGASLSPDQQSVAWYNIFDSTWNVYRVGSAQNINLTKDVSVPFYYVLNDVPNEAPAYGMAGWTKDGRLVVYDEYDLWAFDPSGKKQPVNLTGSYGRDHHLVFRNVRLDRDQRYLPEGLMLSAFNQVDKQGGYYNLHKDGTLQKLVMDNYSFVGMMKARKAPELIWRKMSFSVYPDLYVSNMDFQDVNRISNANPQQKNYLWGSVDLVSWKTFDGDTMQGLLYKPADFDPNKKYPMIVYFYERYSDDIHRYYTPSPSRSVINFSYYTSNGYVVFIPDIKYEDGYPGASAYNCVVSGTQAMCDRYSFINRDRLGMQGQSWGGYQSAFLVTRTNMFRCAEAGAPVSNMTSAYGGIRWGSGMSREFQYEHTQSRIGGTLWDKLPLYMENSPLFAVPRIETPLLIMHNDQDNAVPWYQGIELFSAMRRLGKPVWMLVYNGQPHNLNHRGDEKDLSKRMQQFFDYYLKDAPEPVWMKYGIPAVNKGRDNGFEYAK
ncbi:MAG: S9 family peptidase [Bacteroidales bacterium]|nr:S9 family peptidase [Bacteroidales bacterium]